MNDFWGWCGPREPNGIRIRVYAGIMAYLAEHLSSLRQEITNLQNLNVLYLQRSEHSPGERTASEGRGNRLLQIKEELKKMRNRPDDGVVWWGTSGRPGNAV